MFERGDSILWRGKQCHVCAVDTAGAPGRVELEETDSRQRHLVALSDLPTDMGERVGRYVRGERSFPQHRVTKLGHRITVSRVANEPDQFALGQGDRDVAALRLDDIRRPDETDARLGWRLSFPDGTVRILAAPADEPPVSGALFFVDIALREAERE